MGFTRGSGNKLSKTLTNRSNPIISQPISLRKGLAFTDHENMDENNPFILYFHIFGDIPSEMKLFLFAERFNQNFYTELGQHSHNSGNLSTGGVFAGSIDHDHTFGHDHTFVFDAESEGAFHHHSVRVNFSNPEDQSLNNDNTDAGYVNVAPESGNAYVDLPANFNHTHDIGGDIEGANTNTTSITPGLDDHIHSVNSGNTGLTGSTPIVGSLNTASPKEFFNDLQIEVDGIDQTATLQTQAGVTQFGDGTDTDIIVTNGIELDLTSFISTTGEHKIIFSLGGSNNGGKLRYNLYLLD